MNGARTRGQPAALSAAAAVVDEGRSHALLLVGPGGVGKTMLALDIAARLLCTVEPPAARPCRACRGCRMVDSGNHPDLHRLAPDGPWLARPVGDAEASMHPRCGDPRPSRTG